MINIFGEFIFGLAILIIGSELLLRGATGLKRRLRVPEFVIGLVVVGFGTSLPELIIGMGAAGIGAQELALSMVVGSNIFNLFGVLAIAALIRPLMTDERALKRDGIFMAAAALTLFLFFLLGYLNRYNGYALLVGLILYVIIVARSEHRLPQDQQSLHRAKAAFATRVPSQFWLAGVMALAGAALLTLGSGWVIESSLGLGIDMGIGEATLGLSLVAIATSIPELAVSAIAAKRGNHGVAVGNILGSNIFNIFGVAGLIGVFHGISWPTGLHGGDMIALVGASLLLWLALATDRCLTRREGVLALSVYILYLVWRFGLM